MNQKKLVVYFLILAISLTLFLPILNLSFAYTYTKYRLKDFTKQQLFSTDNLESMIGYSLYKVLNVSTNKAQVIAGKDDFLFLGNTYSSIIDKTKGTFHYTDLEIEQWTTKLKKLQDSYEQRGIEFIVVVASNKHTVYNDKLPDEIVYKEDETMTDSIVKSSLQKDVHILNLKQALRAKKDKQLFFKTDTHWNDYGASIGYTNTMHYLNTIYKKSYQIPNYTMKETRSSGGDLTRFLKINKFLSKDYDKAYRIIFNKKSRVCYGKITKENVLKKCTKNKKKGFNKYTINTSTPNKKKLLYLCDSFGIKNTALYKETFHTVWRFHHAYIYGSTLSNFIKEHKPDIVIYQIVERNLGSNKTVAKLL